MLDNWTSRSARLLAVLCLVAVAAFGVGCGKTSGEEDDAGGTGQADRSAQAKVEGGGSKAAPIEEVAEGETVTIGFSNYAGVIPLYQAMIAGAKETAKGYNWDVVVTDAQFDLPKQISDVQALIARRVDVILISPMDVDALLPAYKAAAEAGIPMVSIANRLNPKHKAYENAFVGIPSVKLGELETEALVEAMGGKGDFLRIKGPSGIAFVRDSAVGTDEVLAEHRGMNEVFSQNAKVLSAEEGFRIARDGLTAHPNVKGIWAQDDELAVGAVRALQRRGLAGKVPVGWNGGTPQAMDLAAKGYLVGPVLPTYQWGKDAVDLLHASMVERADLPFETESANFMLKTPQQAKELIAECPEKPMEIWCLGRK
jgi:ABC-type sugar transport system substrate-binding protein